MKISVVSVVLVGFLFVFHVMACGQKKMAVENNQNPTSSMKKSKEEWASILSPEQYHVLIEKGTESPFTGKYNMHKEKGTYVCGACKTPLFTDDMKFVSHCGWPSFDREIGGNKILKIEDNSLGMHRTEIVCASCGGHLGHIFDDGPTETGQRYCVNSLSLDFEPATMQAQDAKLDTATVAGGCFWCIEAVYLMLDGVKSVTSGYTGGKIKNPAYREVCSGTTGHAEAVQITYDPSVTSFQDILKVFFTVHDPTTLNRQGADVGTQYRSSIFYHNEEQQKIAKEIIQQLNTEKAYDDPIVTEVVPAEVFYAAEEYHQNYYNLNKQQPYCRAVIQPKIDKFEKVFKSKMIKK